MKKAILAAAVALSLVGGARGDEAQIFHLRGECNQLAQAFFGKLEEKADNNCIENFFKGSNYNTKDNRCYLEIHTLQDDVVSNDIIERHKYEWCRRTIKEGIACTKVELYDVQTKEIRSTTWSGKCESNMDKNVYEKYGIVPDSEKKATFFGFNLSLGSEYTRALNFIKSKMEENYRD